MKDIVIVPVFHRTDYTQTCLENLLNARGIHEKQTWIVQDNKESGPDLKPVYDIVQNMLPCFKNAIFWARVPHRDIGYLNNSHDALQKAYDAGAEKIYYLEDDVVVTPDFFEWHDAVQADGDWMCSSAWRRPEGQNKRVDIGAYYQIQFPTTISIGTCFKRDKLAIALRTHDWNPQDRMKDEDWRCVMPYVQRCYHIGSRSNHPGGNSCPPEAVDALPNPIPDYGKTKVALR